MSFQGTGKSPTETLDAWLRAHGAEVLDDPDPGPHLDDELLARLAETGDRPSSEVLQHLARCVICREIYIDLVSELPAQEDRRWSWRPRWLVAAGALASAAAAAFLLMPRAPEQGLTVEVFEGPRATRGAASVGGTLRLGVHHDPDKPTELRVYLRGVQTLVRCPQDPKCQTTSGRLTVDVPLDRRGVYQVLAITSTAPISTPFERFESDYEGLRDHEEVLQSEEIDVR